MPNTRNTARDTLRAALCFAAQMKLLLIEVPIVWFFMWRLKTGALPAQHAWLTGNLPGSQPEQASDPALASIWAHNIAYCSPQRSTATASVNDVEVACKTGEFLRRMVTKSSSDAEIAHGPKRRMPHAVNYIHGAVHHNGLTLIFDDFMDLTRHLRDASFRRELARMARLERREVTFLFRQRDYDVLEFAYCVGVVRNHLPWFSNANGPSKKPVLWGNVAPYPAINLINGAWVRDIFGLARGNTTQLARAPIKLGQYFQGRYGQAWGTSSDYRWLDRFQAWWISMDVRARGFRGQLFFTNRHRIEPHRVAEYRAAGGYLKWSACHSVPFPTRQSKPSAASATSAPAYSASPIVHSASISVIIPTLNEAAAIGACIDSVHAALPGAEVIVSDGGSMDATVAIASARGVRCVHPTTATDSRAGREKSDSFGLNLLPRQDSGGRGAQLARGVQASSGQWLLLLHADCTIEANAHAVLGHAIAAPTLQLAKLTARFDNAQRRYRALERVCAVECALSSFGDQGILVRRAFLEAHQLLQALPLFEDVELFRRARRHTTIKRLPIRVWTSTRRFERLGFLKTHLLNAALVALYFCRVPPARLHRIYYRLGRSV
jgi:hypothetical protein